MRGRRKGRPGHRRRPRRTSGPRPSIPVDRGPRI
uniref:Uncharacterized protein n=1 Tax=Arundo donax TaxID=35708 RepID=A0A0A9AXX0_ARUDO